MADNDQDVLVGEITAPFGRKGEVKVVPHTDFPEHIKTLGKVRADLDGEIRVLEVEKVRTHKRVLIVKFAGYHDISEAEVLRGARLYVDAGELPPLGRDEYYVHDIVGMDVETPDGESLGRVREVICGPANDVYVTDRAMIPAVKEFVLSIDVEKQRMIVRPIPGMVQE